ncbi:MAG TPA: hypothetical protein VHW92_01425 [Mycobacteriales bacterium]|jgi:hypothetical protein|nr:hypothetical protein [Mycobacteriales bacterium]
MPRTTARRRTETGDRVAGFLHRHLLPYFGPASVMPLGDPYPPIDPDPACPHCGSHESEHLAFRTSDGKSLRRCPTG